jgi:hypothetical protein
MILSDKYQKVDNNTYLYYDTETKYTVNLIFHTGEIVEDIEKKVTDILSQLYLESQI